MTPEALRRLLEDVRAGRTPVESALEALRWMPYADLGFAKPDAHRPLRRGAPEAVYCPGKTPAQVMRIAAELLEAGGPVLLTRAGDDVVREALAAFPSARHVPDARLIVLGALPAARGCVGVLTGGTGDVPVAEEAAWTSAAMGAAVERAYDVGVSGLHRLGAHRDLIERAHALVVVAGMDGALPAVVAGLARVPVIGVPTSVGYGAHLGGLAPLLTMVNACAPGVAVVNVDNGYGAGYLAALINAAANRPSTDGAGAGRATDCAPADGDGAGRTTASGGIDARRLP